MLNKLISQGSSFKSIVKPSRTVGSVRQGTGNEVTNREIHEANMGYQNLVNELEEYHIQSLNFGILDDATIERMSVTRINIADKTKEANHVNSIDMGSTKIGEICTKCKLQFPSCGGHYGHIELPTPIIHPLLKKELVKVLSVICHNCCKIRLPESSIQSSGIMRVVQSRRLHDLVELVGDDMTCPHCKRVNKSIATGEHGPDKISLKSGPALSMSDIQTMLLKTRLTADQLKVMGYEGGSHPADIIITKLLVIPPVHRPDVIIDGRVKHSDLTDAYSTIIRSCTEYTEAVRIHKSETEINSKLDIISRNILKLFTNPDTGSGKDPKGILESFKGKESVTRQGRRTNLNARSVLGPAPHINYGEIAVPIEQAKVLLRTEKITRYNITKMKEYMALGQIENVILAGTVNKIKVKDETRWKYVMELKPGDTVFRHFMDGDIIIFVRQPTLQKESMSAYSARIWNQRTIGMHLSSTNPHNADFDGDEGNLFGVVGQQAIAETDLILNARNNIISSQSGRPNVGLVMNALSGGYALTAKDVLVSKELFYECLDILDVPLNILDFEKRVLARGGKMYYQESDSDNIHLIRTEQELLEHRPNFVDGKVLFSATLPPTLQYQRGGVTIQDGILLSGQLGKGHIGASHGSIVQIIYADFGSAEASRFVTNATKVLDIYSYRRGITVSIYDYCPWLGNSEKKTALDDERREIIARLKGKIAEMAVPNKCNTELVKRYENKIVEHMEQATNDIGISVLNKFMDPSGGIAIMANSGAKGSTVNAAHTTGMIGPQYDRGERMTLSITNNTRTTPYVVPNDTDVTSRGFITSNYSEGVTPLDAAHASVSTRNAVVDTAVGVADAGYLTRRLVRYTEDVTTAYNRGVVINAAKPSGKDSDIKRSVSLIYGDDNYDTTKLELVRTPIGEIFLPVDIYRVVAKLNSKHGFYDNSGLPSCSPYMGSMEFED